MDDIKALSELASSTAKEFVGGAILPDEAKAVADAIISLVTALRMSGVHDYNIAQLGAIGGSNNIKEKTAHGTQTVENVSGFGRIVRHTLGREDSE